MSFLGYGQEDMIISHSRFMQKTNPSFFGMNNINKTGVLYNSQGMISNNRIESQYFFGAISINSIRLCKTFFSSDIKSS